MSEYIATDEDVPDFDATPVPRRQPDRAGTHIKVTVDAIRPIDKGSLRAFASISIAGLKIHNVRIVQQAGQSPWVAMPSSEIPAKPGDKKRYFPIVEILDPQLKGEISDLVLAAHARAIAAQPTPPVRANIPAPSAKGRAC